jgi:hypothetical protein
MGSQGCAHHGRRSTGGAGFRRRATSSWPWWPARCSAGWGAPADLWRREAAQHVWLGVLELSVASVCSGMTLCRRIEDGRRRACGSGGLAWLRACAAQEGRGTGARLGRAAFIGHGRGVPLARTPRRGGRRRPYRVRHGHWPRPGSGPGWAKAGRGWPRAGRAFGLGPLGKNLFFLEFIFNAKTIPEKSRNCSKARKILQKSQKFQETSQR